MISPYVVDGLTWRNVTTPAAVKGNKLQVCYGFHCNVFQSVILASLIIIFLIFSLTIIVIIVITLAVWNILTLICSVHLCLLCTVSDARNSPNLYFVASTWFEHVSGVLSLCSTPLYSSTPTNCWSTGWSLTISHSIHDRSWIVATRRWSPCYDQSIYGSGWSHLE